MSAKRRKRTKRSPIVDRYALLCPNCGGETDRPYLDCTSCRRARRRMTPEERRATIACFPGLDADESRSR